MTSTMPRSLPKVLIAGQPFNNDTGGGVTLTNLFQGWERDRLAVVCLGYLLQDNIDARICNTYYQLGREEHKWTPPFNLMKRKYDSGPVHLAAEEVQSLAIPVPKFRVKLIMNYFFPLVEYAGLIHWISRLELSDRFRDWLREFNPDVIYGQANSRKEVAFCIALQAFTGKPLVFHMMDDWPSSISSKGLFKHYWKKVIDRELRVLLDNTSILMTISDFMSEEYQKRYGKDSIVFHNPINLAFWKKEQRSTYVLQDRPTLLYAGRTGQGIDASLQTIALATQYVNKELDIDMKFIIQTGEKPAWIEKYDCVQYRHFVPYQDLPAVFAGADFLILPYDFSPSSVNFIQYSMPTKVSEYMISGTPVIVFAPQQTALAKYAQKHKWAQVATQNDPRCLADTIKYLVLNEAARWETAQMAIQVAAQRHDSAHVANEFKRTLCSIAQKAEWQQRSRS